MWCLPDVFVYGFPSKPESAFGSNQRKLFVNLKYHAKFRPFGLINFKFIGCVDNIRLCVEPGRLGLKALSFYESYWFQICSESRGR